MLNAAALALLLASAATAFPANSTLNAPRKIGRRCTGQIQSLSDVAAAQECTTIVIGGFTVPAGSTFALSPPDGASVSLTGALTFGVQNWAGPLMTITGNDITFNGNGHEIVGNGDQYWDGQGINGGVTKPDPMLRINMGGTFTNLKLVNSPGRAIAIGGSSLTVSAITVDNCKSAGAAANSKSGGKPAGANTDGFDVSANSVTISGSTVNNQDDCLAINRGTGITFTGNTCTGGHGISIGSIASGVTVSNVQITGNTVTNSVNGLRIKTQAAASGSTVSGVTYSNNKLSGITQFGVIIDQSYPATLGTPGTGVVINTVTFSGTNTVAVGSAAKRVEVNCGSTSTCTGTWNWAGLTVTGGAVGAVKNAKITGGSF
ncbi:glycoside hydrolase [Roridomyces roridus]|uniref:endo-polygalacturonase n=1 Tax=Roridomyces roridus TaxID=1738132 RepID=A0AAD7BCR9_9AGAR|nr:glycoside hydrolase [Roridomyces roridus]